ncbi:LamG domain-containing protein [Pseudoalteromonas sp. J010]|uniref:LamG domain-containing protein n=1 Tax=Pseudoalteromonas sp. J010 TaxID=998465 RepID=UPI00163AD099|nr:LamG domain-containing protein [Pseudoalteromonas sp. J010]
MLLTGYFSRLLIIFISFFSFFSYALDKNPDGLVSLWKLDNAQAVIDSVGENHGTFYNGPVTTQGKNNLGIKFDGVNDTAIIPDSESLNFGNGDFTVAFWVKKLQPTTSNWNRCAAVNKWHSGDKPGTNEWHLSICSGRSSKGLTFGVEVDKQSVSVRDYEALTLNEWYFITGVREGEYIKLYRNGELRGTEYVGNGSIADTSRRLRFATWEKSTLYSHSASVLDDVQIYSRALSETEIARLSQGGLFAKSTLQLCESQLDSAKLSINSLSTQVFTLRNLSNILENKVASLVNENDSLNKTISELTHTTQNQQQEITELENSNMLLLEESAQKDVHISTLNQEILNLKAELAALKGE